MERSPVVWPGPSHAGLLFDIGNAAAIVGVAIGEKHPSNIVLRIPGVK